MDLLSLSFLTLGETSPVDSLKNDFMDHKTAEERLTREKKLELTNDRKKSRRKISDNDSLTEHSDKCFNIISLDELAWHDSAEDCWVAIYDYVYDCTEFVKSHPGGQDVLLEYAGRDATLAFIGTGHSVAARKVLEKFIIGELPADERIFRITGGVKIVE